MSAPRPTSPPKLAPVLILCVLATGCAARAVSAELDSPATCAEPEPCPVCPEPEPPPPLHSPMVHGGYSVELAPASGNLYAEKYFNFVGAVVQIRVRYLDEPKGDIQESTYITCEAELEVPVRWTERGFYVEQTITVTSERGDFTRREIQGKGKGAREANHDKFLKSCWLTVLEGEYQISQISEETTRGRAKHLELVEPDGKIRALAAVPPASESDFLEVVDDHFWSQP